MGEELQVGEELPVGEEPRHQEAESKLLRAGPWADRQMGQKAEEKGWGHPCSTGGEEKTLNCGNDIHK